MTPTIEQIKEILAGAPDGFTHYEEKGFSLSYYRKTGKGVWMEQYRLEDGKVKTIKANIGGMVKSLSDLRTILAQHEEIAAKAAEIERLKAELVEVAATAVESILEWQHSYIQTDEAQFAYYDYAIEQYANQLREQGNE